MAVEKKADFWSSWARVTGALALAALFTASVDAQEIKNTPSKSFSSRKRVYGPQDAQPYEFPFQVSLILADAKKGEEFNNHFCGGALISDTWVLTAGHCVTTDGEVVNPKVINIYAGSINFENGDRIPVIEIYRHPQFELVANSLENNLALLKLERAPRKEVKVARIDLIDPMKHSMLEMPGIDVTFTGWGINREGSLSKNLHYTLMRIVDRSECNNNILEYRAATLGTSLSEIFQKFHVVGEERKKNIRAAIINNGGQIANDNFLISEDKMKDLRKAILDNAGEVVTENMVCAGDPSPPSGVQFVHDSCQGDSGGPLFAMVGGKPIEVGIVSWGEGCGIPKVHGVYTRLSKFVEWIKSTAKY
jgi:secreted trypsin-like serine protease